jgi:hypothetical protein
VRYFKGWMDQLRWQRLIPSCFMGTMSWMRFIGQRMPGALLALRACTGANQSACAVLLLRARAKPVHVEFGLSTYVYFPVDDHRG